MLAGERYDPRDPELAVWRERARERCRRYNAAAATETARRERLLGGPFGTAGADATVEPPFRCDYGCNVGVGDGVRIGGRAVLTPGVAVDDGAVGRGRRGRGRRRAGAHGRWRHPGRGD